MGKRSVLALAAVVVAAPLIFHALPAQPESAISQASGTSLSRDAPKPRDAPKARAVPPMFQREAASFISGSSTRTVPAQPSKRADPKAVVASVPMPATADRRVVVTENTGSGPQVRTVPVENESAALSTVQRLRRDPRVAAVDIDTRVSSIADYTSQQWALSNLDTTTAWSSVTGAGVVVAVVDTGVHASHPDLAGRVAPGAEYLSADGTSTGDGRTDPHGHGTHVAGIVAADADSDLVTGIAPAAMLMPIRVLDSSGSGWNSDVAAGILYAAQNGADLINLSLGSGYSSSIVSAAIAYALDSGVAVFAAAGNGGPDAAPTYPAANQGVVGVAATDSDNVIAWFSNRGSYVDLAAPGVSILSSYPPATVATMSGTSMATPYTVGSAALALAAARIGNPDATGAETVPALINSATDLGPVGRDDSYGYGLVNPSGAIAGLVEPTPTPTEPTPTPTPTEPEPTPTPTEPTPTPTPTEPTPTPTPEPVPLGPGAPTNLKVIANASKHRLIVTFRSPLSIGSNPVTGYYVKCVSSKRSLSAKGEASIRGVMFYKVKAPGSYRCRARAANGVWGTWTDLAPATRKARAKHLGFYRGSTD